MITKETIDKIFEAARIEEVIGDFINLKKSGSSYKGISPFSEERTPSFMVSPAKQIFKDFSSGKGGSVVTFLMEHEQMSYPEALRFLAEKYNITIEETVSTPEQEESRGRRESLYIASEWAENYFINALHNSEEGQAIGLSYFQERGFTAETIETFRLGYAFDRFDAMVNAAKKEGYKQEFLIELGLLKSKNEQVYDGFKGRVMFPIHNLSGRALGFGARTLKTDKKIPKYLNSPECEIYHKSKIVYGIYQAKKFIVKEDCCYLVEGYTDVISMHQAGVKNVVASSGTALTADQVRLIGRYTKNITILYDADPAGIKASFRGIDIILSEGLNVKAALLPEGEDPDSFSKKNDLDEIRAYFSESEKDFIVFKTQLLNKETQGDPIKKASLVRGIIETIAIIPDSISRSIYVKECSTLLDIPEKALLSELNKIRQKNNKEEVKKRSVAPPADMDPSQMDPSLLDPSLLDDSLSTPTTEKEPGFNSYYQERDIVRIMLNFGMEQIEVEGEDENGEVHIHKIGLAQFVQEELEADELFVENPVLLEIYTSYLTALQQEPDKDPVHALSNHPNTELRELVVDLVTEKYNLHKWASQNIDVVFEHDRIFRSIRDALYAFKARKINALIEEKRLKLKHANLAESELSSLLEELRDLDDIRRQLLLQQGITIFR